MSVFEIYGQLALIYASPQTAENVPPLGKIDGEWYLRGVYKLRSRSFQGPDTLILTGPDISIGVRTIIQVSKPSKTKIRAAQRGI